MVLLFLLTLWGACPANSQGNSQWDMLTSQPGRRALVVVEQAVAASAQPCDAHIVPTERQRAKLFQLIRQGNQWAFQGALLVAACWDGGESEDFHRTAGLFFEGRPRLFLQIVAAKGVGDAALRDMITMLPLEAADDIDRMISIVDRRTSLLRGVRGPSLEEVAGRGLEYLDQERRQLEKTRAELQPRRE